VAKKNIINDALIWLDLPNFVIIPLLPENSELMKSKALNKRTA
jgi:hypothetical protein